MLILLFLTSHSIKINYVYTFIIIIPNLSRKGKQRTLKLNRFKVIQRRKLSNEIQEFN
jgi:hypothetical protein